MLLNLVCLYLVRDFCIYIHGGYIFLSCDWFGFAIRIMLGSKNELGSAPSSIIVELSISTFKSVSFYFMYFGDLVID